MTEVYWFKTSIVCDFLPHKINIAINIAGQSDFTDKRSSSSVRSDISRALLAQQPCWFSTRLWKSLRSFRRKIFCGAAGGKYLFCRAGTVGGQAGALWLCGVCWELNIKTESPVEKMAIKPGVGPSGDIPALSQPQTQLVTKVTGHCFVFNYNYWLDCTLVLSEIAISSPVEINPDNGGLQWIQCSARLTVAWLQ